MTLLIPRKQYQRGLFLILFFGVLICVWQLGSTGLMDETPPLFAAASRAMTETGDWLTPRVNGLPRFDKPPFVYWLMGFFYSLPGQNNWDPLGSWSARLPSALSTVLMMLFLGDTLMRWSPRSIVFPRRTALVTALAFALSPLVIIWSRIAVSDALLCSTLGISLLLHWRTYVRPTKNNWIWGWIFLGLAVLTKGPVSIAITFICLMLFGLAQRDFSFLLQRIRVLKGLSIVLLVSLPWYLLELIIEGKAFFNSFFGYHNLQRLTSVVNSHSEPWWFFGLILIIASLPFTPYLILGIWDAFSYLLNPKKVVLKEDSLYIFASCWLISILFLFTLAATKLPSYWIPATPAAGILIGLTASKIKGNSLREKLVLPITTFIVFVFSVLLWFLKSWIYLINDPEMPFLATALISSKVYLYGAIILSLTTLSGIYLLKKNQPWNVLIIQITLVIFQVFFMLPIWKIADNLRQLPLRSLSELIISTRLKNEQIAMVGINKPSLHFYTNQIVFYENANETGVINLSERLEKDKRNTFEVDNQTNARTILLVIDEKTSGYSFWQGIEHQVLGQFSIYSLWRVDRINLKQRANEMKSIGIKPNWREPNPERI